MSRDMKSKRAPAKKKSAGGTLIGLFIGLVLGIVGAAAVAWVVGTAQAPVLLPFLAGVEPMFSEHGQMLWRVDARRQAMPSCAGMPSGG